MPLNLKKLSSVAGWFVALGIGLALVGLLVVGKSTRDAVRGWDRYAITFTDIQCTPPPGQERQGFLAEVQYVAGMPNRLSVLDEDLASHIADAFAHHPWVERVEKVAVLPARQIEARLRFRIPALEVKLLRNAHERPSSPIDSHRSPQSTVLDEPSWVVDGSGFVLPRAPAGDNLPLLFTEVGPAGGAGRLWGHEAVEAAARTAAYLRPHQSALRLMRFQVAQGELVLSTAAGTRVFWGHALNSEPAGEAAAAQKLERLLDHCASHGDLDHPAGHYEYDVRPAAAAIHGFLAPEDAP